MTTGKKGWRTEKLFVDSKLILEGGWKEATFWLASGGVDQARFTIIPILGAMNIQLFAVVFDCCSCRPQPTLPTRGWLVNPFDIPLWVIPATILPAMLATILIFMDQQITAVIVNRKENKLRVIIVCLYAILRFPLQLRPGFIRD